MGELADVACGDAWHLYEGDANPGLSVIVARTFRGKELVEDAARHGYVTLTRTDVESILKSQGGTKGIAGRRRAVWGRLFALRALGIPRPRYGREFRLFSAWMTLPLSQKLKSIGGTVLRAFRKRLFKAQEMGRSEVR
jgi:coenzyme F420 hydrogenase subunit beta